MRRTSTFRIALAGLAAIIAGPAVAQCVQPDEKLGFDVRLMQSTLQVAALQCRSIPAHANFEDQYRSFVQRFQGEFTTSSRGLQDYFRRTAGANHSRALDSYITNLAQAQASEGSAHGSLYCPNIAPLFRAALAQSSVNGLAEVSRDFNLLNTIAVAPCPTAATRTAARTPPRRPAR